MPLFPTKSYGELVWDDLREFLHRDVPESELLDYKEAMPEKPIETTIAAMANTYGGDIIIGVAQDRARPGRRQPVEEVGGISDATRVQAQIEDRNLHVRPPVLSVYPEIVPIPQEAHPDRAADHAIIVVRVRESDLTPHWVPGVGIYGRAGARNKPYNDVPLEPGKIEWLLDRRKRHSAFREELVRFADDVYPAYAWHKTWCAPLYPGEPLWAGCPAKTIEQVIPRFGTSSRGSLPFYAHRTNLSALPRPVQHGWVWVGEDTRNQIRIPTNDPRWSPSKPFVFYSVDSRGVFAHKAITDPELSGMKKPAAQGADGVRGAGAVRFDWTTVTLSLVGTCEHAARLYEEFGYSGPVQFGVEVGVDARGYSGQPLLGRLEVYPEGSGVLDWWDEAEPLARDQGMMTPGLVVSDSDQCLASELRERARLSEVHRRWVRAFGYEPSDEELRDRLDVVSRFLNIGASS